MNLEQRVEALEKTIAAIKAALVGGNASGGAPAVASDDLMGRDWADMEIRKDPPRTAQPSHVGKRMSECTAEYLLDYASFHEWKAAKGREENPPRLNNKGKPWYESDELTAKVARGWAARVKPAAKTKPKPTTMNTAFEFDDEEGEAPPF